MYFEMFHRIKDIVGNDPEKLDVITCEMLYSYNTKEADENVVNDRIYSGDTRAVCV